MCSACGDKGLIRVNWTDAPEDYAVCLCAVGQDMRAEANEGKATAPLWRVWCAREQVDPARVVMVEDVATADELRELGLSTEPPPIVSVEATLLNASKRKR